MMGPHDVAPLSEAPTLDVRGARERVSAGIASEAPVRPARSSRKVAILLHRTAGLVTAPFLLVAGLTGSLIAFYHELDATLSPELHRVVPPSPGAKLLEPSALWKAARAQLPEQVQLSYLPLQSKPGEAVLLWTEPFDGATSDADDEYFFDPYSGALLGSRRWGDLGQGTKNLLPFMYRLHYSLGLGQLGSYLFGIIALLWTFDCFFGAYVTLPPRRRLGDTRRSWLIRWGPSWRLRAHSVYAFVFTWHRASGLWVWGMLLVFAWSAVGLNLREVYNPVMNAVLGMNDRARSTIPELASPRHAPKLDFEAALTTARALMAVEADEAGFHLEEEVSLGYDAARGTYAYRVRSSLDISDRYPATMLWFDGETGSRLAFEGPTGGPAGNTVTTWLYQLHFGSVAVLGWPYRVFVSLVGLGVAALSLTGVWIWWRKRAKRLSAQLSR